MANTFTADHDMTWIVYIVEKQGRYYTGITTDLANRVRQHGHAVVLHVERYADQRSAAARERKIKGWSRSKKERLWSAVEAKGVHVGELLLPLEICAQRAHKPWFSIEDQGSPHVAMSWPVRAHGARARSQLQHLSFRTARQSANSRRAIGITDLSPSLKSIIWKPSDLLPRSSHLHRYPLRQGKL